MPKVLDVLIVGANDIANYLINHRVMHTTHTNNYDEAIELFAVNKPRFDIVIIDAVIDHDNALRLLDTLRWKIPFMKIPLVYVVHTSSSCTITVPNGEKEWRLPISLSAHYPFAGFHKRTSDEVPWLCEVLLQALPPVSITEYK